MLFHCLLAAPVFVEKTTVIWILLPHEQSFVFFWFSRLFFVFSFQQFYYDACRCGFLWIYPFLYSLSFKAIGLGPSPIGGVSVIISVHCLLSPLLLGLFDTNIRSFHVVPQVPKALFIFIEIFSLLFRLDHIYLSLIFMFTDFFLCCIHSDVDPIQWLFF